jgi:hypothetical protein
MAGWRAVPERSNCQINVRHDRKMNRTASFTPAALRFFRQLEKNNNKPWFEAHRAEYEQEVREPMRTLIEENE